jgi:hypothetical protein
MKPGLTDRWLQSLPVAMRTEVVADVTHLSVTGLGNPSIGFLALRDGLEWPNLVSVDLSLPLYYDVHHPQTFQYSLECPVTRHEDDPLLHIQQMNADLKKMSAVWSKIKAFHHSNRAGEIGLADSMRIFRNLVSVQAQITNDGLVEHIREFRALVQRGMDQHTLAARRAASLEWMGEEEISDELLSRVESLYAAMPSGPSPFFREPEGQTANMPITRCAFDGLLFQRMEQSMISLRHLYLSFDGDEPSYLVETVCGAAPQLTHLFVDSVCNCLTQTSCANFQSIRGHHSLQHVYWKLDSTCYTDDDESKDQAIEDESWISDRAGDDDRYFTKWVDIAMSMQENAGPRAQIHMCLSSVGGGLAMRRRHQLELCSERHAPPGLMVFDHSTASEHNFDASWSQVSQTTGCQCNCVYCTGADLAAGAPSRRMLAALAASDAAKVARKAAFSKWGCMLSLRQLEQFWGYSVWYKSAMESVRRAETEKRGDRPRPRPNDALSAIAPPPAITTEGRQNEKGGEGRKARSPNVQRAAEAAARRRGKDRQGRE